MTCFNVFIAAMLPCYTRKNPHEGHHPRRRFRDPAVSTDHRDVQAAGPHLQQADDLLPALYTDARRHPGDSRHHDAVGPGSVPPAPWQREASRDPHRLRLATEPG